MLEHKVGIEIRNQFNDAIVKTAKLDETFRVSHHYDKWNKHNAMQQMRLVRFKGKELELDVPSKLSEIISDPIKVKQTLAKLFD